MMLDATKGDVQRCVIVPPRFCWEYICWQSTKSSLPCRELLEKELESVGIRLNRKKPNIYFKVCFLVFLICWIFGINWFYCYYFRFTCLNSVFNCELLSSWRSKKVVASRLTPQSRWPSALRSLFNSSFMNTVSSSLAALKKCHNIPCFTCHISIWIIPLTPSSEIFNAEVLFREDSTPDDFIDVIVGNRVYMPCLYVCVLYVVVIFTVASICRCTDLVIKFMYLKFVFAAYSLSFSSHGICAFPGLQ